MGPAAPPQWRDARATMSLGHKVSAHGQSRVRLYLKRMLWRLGGTSRSTPTLSVEQGRCSLDKYQGVYTPRGRRTHCSYTGPAGC